MPPTASRICRASQAGGASWRTFTARSTRPSASSPSPWNDSGAATTGPARTGASARIGRPGVGVVVRVVVRVLRRADAVLEAGHGPKVHAGVAVHPDVAGERLAVPLGHQPGDLVAVAEHAGAADVQAGMAGRVPGRLLGDPVREDPGEQEVAGH